MGLVREHELTAARRVVQEAWSDPLDPVTHTMWAMVVLRFDPLASVVQQVVAGGHPEHPDLAALAQALGTLGRSHRARGEFELAAAAFETTIGLAVHLADGALRARAELELGRMRRVNGAFDAAREHFATAEGLFAAAGRADDSVVCRLESARVELSASLFDQAEADLEELKEVLQVRGLQQTAADCHRDLASLHLQSGRFDEAAAELESARRVDPGPTNQRLCLLLQASMGSAPPEVLDRLRADRFDLWCRKDDEAKILALDYDVALAENLMSSNPPDAYLRIRRAITGFESLGRTSRAADAKLSAASILMALAEAERDPTEALKHLNLADRLAAELSHFFRVELPGGPDLLKAAFADCRGALVSECAARLMPPEAAAPFLRHAVNLLIPALLQIDRFRYRFGSSADRADWVQNLLRTPLRAALEIAYQLGDLEMVGDLVEFATATGRLSLPEWSRGAAAQGPARPARGLVLDPPPLLLRGPVVADRAEREKRVVLGAHQRQKSWPGALWLW